MHPKIKLKLKKHQQLYLKKLMLARKFVSYRLHMAGIIQNKQKCLIFVVATQGRKSVEKEEEKKN